jgi:ligand-binding sensor domain-containing protein/signal transduction histidine kinase
MKSPNHGWWLGLRCVLLIGGVSVALPAAAAASGTGAYKVRVWQTEEGLPQNSVYAIAQTLDGYLWVGTHEGLARFDGLRFVTLDEKAPPELRHGWITALCAARDGSLWIACDGYGLSRLKGGAFSRLSESDGLLSNQTKCLLEGSDGSLWIGSKGGLSRYKDGQFANFIEADNLGINSVQALCEGAQGVIRAATMRGLSSLSKDGNITTVKVGTGATANVLKSVCQDRLGNIWVASNEGLTCQGPSDRHFYDVNKGLPNKAATALFEDRAERVWVGTYNGVACLVDGKIVSKPMNEAGMGDLVNAIFEDREENLWVGGRDGLYRLSPARFQNYTVQEGLTCNNVMSVCEDGEGSIWLGTWGGGLNRLRNDRIVAFSTTNGWTHDEVLALHLGLDGNLWVGMDHGGGLSRLKDGRPKPFPRQGGLIDAAIRVIYEEGEGTLWIGTSAGLNISKGDTLAAYTITNGLPGNTVLAISGDAKGNVWVGTDGGLQRWTEGKATTFTTRDGLSTNGINAIYQDSGGNLWLGTRGGGLNRLRAGKFSAYTTRQGLFSDEIYEILEDDFGYFWMSCRTGIFRASKKDFDELDRGKIEAVTCVAFGKGDGLASVQCNGVAKPAGWKGKDGQLWFPTIRGVVAVDSRIKTNDQPPPVAIEDIIADKKTFPSPKPEVRAQSVLAATLDLGREALEIPPGRGELEIHYTALSFVAPRKNRFKYMLEPVDAGWHEAGTRREAHYSNLGPGHYRFRVLACNNDGVWNEAGATLALVLLPHYWQTWWFKLSLAAALVLLLSGLYRARVARLRALERLRVQIAADLHDDVGARLTKVAMVTELVDHLTTEADRSKPHVRNIARTTREIIQAMDEIVWTINPKNDTLDNLANYMFQYAQEYFQNSGVRCRVDLPAGLPDRAVSTEERHNLFMVIKEALNNVLKHAQATEVRIGLAASEGRVTFTVTDNGRGFLPGTGNGSGNGLENMKQRLDRIGGRLVLESQPGAGTKITMMANGK